MAKATKEFILICKFSFKNSNRVVYKVRSNQANKKGRIEGRDQVERKGQWFDCYEVSCNEEYVCGCQGSGEQCPGNRFKGTCGHRQFIERVIEAHKAVKVVELPVKVNSIETAPLNGAQQSSSFWAGLPSRQKVEVA